MKGISVSARFPDGEALDGALGDLRRLGALRCRDRESPPTLRGAATLHITIRPGDASMARAVIRRAGGVIF